MSPTQPHRPARLAGAFLAVLTLAFLMVPMTAQAAEWAPNTPYAVGALVTYQGPTYKCLQAHTSLVGWEPPNTPALWQLQSGTSPTATPTPTPGSRTVPTATPTPTPTSGGGGTCTAPTW